MILPSPGLVSRQRPHRWPTSPYFMLFHNPASWEFTGGEWLPKLTRLPFAPGVNGVRQSRAGAPVDPNLAIVQMQARGFKAIPEDFDGGFVTQVPVAGGVAHLLKFDTLKRVGSASILKHDGDGYAAFRRKMLADGVVDAPEPEVLEPLIERQQARINRRANELHLPHVKLKSKADVEALKQMRAAANV